jgi:hypothetical protein
MLAVCPVPQLRMEGQVQNANPNYEKIREYGRIEWHAGTAKVVAASSRPLDMVAYTLSSCLGIAVSAEDPEYRFVGDLLDVTAPQWAAQHPGQYAYAAKPGTVEITFEANENGMPRDLHGLLQGIVQQVNLQQSNIYSYELREDVSSHRRFYSFVPTSTHSETGTLVHVLPYLDQPITLPERTAPVFDVATLMADALSVATVKQFSCCQASVVGRPWGMESIAYHATAKTARTVLEDLLAYTGATASYALRCEPLGKRCFISLQGLAAGPPPAAPKSGVCVPLGFQGY